MYNKLYTSEIRGDFSNVIEELNEFLDMYDLFDIKYIDTSNNPKVFSMAEADEIIISKRRDIMLKGLLDNVEVFMLNFRKSDAAIYETGKDKFENNSDVFQIGFNNGSEVKFIAK